MTQLRHSTEHNCNAGQVRSKKSMHIGFISPPVQTILNKVALVLNVKQENTSFDKENAEGGSPKFVCQQRLASIITK
jgi:hypothetical protein